MRSDNRVAERLLHEARRKTAQLESPTFGRVSLGAGILAVLACPVPVAAWTLAAITLAIALVAHARPASARNARVATVLAGVAILLGIAVFALTMLLTD